MQPDKEINITYHNAAEEELQLPKQPPASYALPAKDDDTAVLLHHLRHAYQSRHDHEDDASADRQRTDQLQTNSYGLSREQARAVVLDARIQLPGLQNAKENSGSSDISAAYFSGDSDLTAEQPIVRKSCLADENEPDEAVRSTNSGSSSSSSNPVLQKCKRYVSRNVSADHFIPSAQPDVESKKRPVRELKISHSREMASSTNLINLAPGKGTTWGSPQPYWLLEGHDRSNLMASPDQEIMHLQLARKGDQQINVHSSCMQRSSCSPADLADSGTKSLPETWLELRLSLNEVGITYRASAGSEMDYGADEARRSIEKDLTNGFESTEPQRVTLQLLPSEHLCIEAPSATDAPAPPALQRDQHSAAPADLVVGSTSTDSYTPRHINMFPTSTPTPDIDRSSFHSQLVTCDALPLACSQNPDYQAGERRDRLKASSRTQSFHEALQHANRGSNHCYFHPSPFLGSNASPYNHHMQNSINGERGSIWINSSEAFTETVSIGRGVPMTINEAVAQTSAGEAWPSVEVHRPTASFGWAAQEPAALMQTGSAFGTASHLSAVYNNTRVPRGMSWQGLLRSMADPSVSRTQYTMREHMSTPPDFHNLGVQISQLTPAMKWRRRPPSASETLPQRPGAAAITHPAARLFGRPRRLRLAFASRRRSSDLWFSLQEEGAAEDRHYFTSKHEQTHLCNNNFCAQKLYLRIRDGRMQISVVKNYLVKKLRFADSLHHSPDEVDITCRGQLLSSTLTMQHVRDTIWLPKDMGLESMGFKNGRNHIYTSQSGVMALCYQRHHTSQNLTLNLLKA